ncbi:TC3A transposase, partial [Pseudoatta argentina]
MLWSREQRAFAVESFFCNGRSVVATQRAFRARFEISPHRLVPGRNSILSWVNSFQECGSVAKPRNGRQRNSGTPEAVERVRQSILRSPRRSARKHAVALGISDTTVRRILHEELQFHPYKLAVVRGDLPWPARSPDLSPCDFFLWGYLKSLVYVDRPRTIDHLKNNIRDAIANIPIDMLRRVDENFKKRLNQCMRDGGRHLTDVIFKTV